jgi:hypothetical protein
MKKRVITSGLMLSKFPQWVIWIIDTILFILPLKYREVNKFLLSITDSESMKDIFKRFLNKVGDDYYIDWNNIKIPQDEPLTIVCNHPGGRDILMAILASGRDDVTILANKRMVDIVPQQIAKHLVSVNTSAGKGKKTKTEAIDEAYKAGKAVLWFPSGLDSRWNTQGKLVDPVWRSSFLSQAMKHKTKILVLHCVTKNSGFFYKLDRLIKKMEKAKSLAFLKKAHLLNFFQLRELFVKQNSLIRVAGLYEIPDFPTNTAKREYIQKLYDIAHGAKQ